MTKNNKNSQTDAKLFVISAPSGAGKTTLVRALLASNPRVRFSISYTTRAPRVREKNGDDYFFIDKEEFKKMIATGEFLEYAEVFDNLYGTSKSQVQKELDAGQHVLLEIDWQGAQQIRQAWPDCVSVFILPPSLPELERRLRTRATDSETVIQRRLRDAISDIGHWPEFDHVILNDNLKQALQDLKHVVAGISEQTRTDNPDQIDLIHRCGFSTAARLADSEEE